MSEPIMLDADEIAIIRGLEMQPPAPKSIKLKTTSYYKRNECECPDCGLFIREVGYNIHWSKAHKQKYQIAYFKEVINSKLAAMGEQ